MNGKTISDWIAEARKQKKDLDKFHTEKKQDMKRLEDAKSMLPQFSSLTLPYSEFTKSNKTLMEFISRYKGFCVRALPNEKGLKKGFTRKNQRGWLSFEDCKDFLSGVIKENIEDYDVGINDWEPNIYGFVLISGARKIYGEIGRDLEALSHGGEEILASFIIDKAKLGHIENKTIWEVEKNGKAKKLLLKAFNYLCFPGGNFDPYCLKGYFEGVLLESGEVRFLDYKINPAYLSQ